MYARCLDCCNYRCASEEQSTAGCDTSITLMCNIHHVINSSKYTSCNRSIVGYDGYLSSAMQIITIPSNKRDRSIIYMIDFS